MNQRGLKMANIFNLKKMGKKGGIPAINEIVMTILNVTPQPILFLIFILLITTIATFVIPLFLNLFGYACVYEGGDYRLYQVPFNNIATKSLQDVQEGVTELFSLPTYEIPEDPFPYGTIEYIRIPDGCFKTVNNGTSGEVYGYTGLCTDCPVIANFPYPLFGENATTSLRYEQSVCIGDGEYLKTIWNTDVFGANYCYRCSPPTGYYYNHSNVNLKGWVFTIEDPSLIGVISPSEISSSYKAERIKNLGGVDRPQDS